MKKIVIANEKGGTAKTTTAVSLAAALGEMGKGVLLVDLDGQAAASRWLGVEQDSRLADALLRGGGLEPIKDVIPGVSLAPASGKLDSVSHDLRPTQGGQLRKVLVELEGQYDYVLIDCPPSLANRLIGNALLAATHAIVPVETSILALDGLRILLAMFEDIRGGFEHDIELIGVLACRYDGRTRLSRLVVEEMKRALGRKVFRTIIRQTVRIQECPASGKSILEYAPHSFAAKDYRELARELVSSSCVTRNDIEVNGDVLSEPEELSLEEKISVLDFRNHMATIFGDTCVDADGANQQSESFPSAVPVMPQRQYDLDAGATETTTDQQEESDTAVEMIPDDLGDSSDDTPVEQTLEASLDRDEETGDGADSEFPEGNETDLSTQEPATGTERAGRWLAKRPVAVAGLAAGVLVWVVAGVLMGHAFSLIRLSPQTTSAAVTEPLPDRPEPGKETMMIINNDAPAKAPVIPPVETHDERLESIMPTPALPARPDLSMTHVTEINGIPQAIINGQCVKAGERVAGATVIQIHPTSAQLEFNGERFVVSVSTAPVHEENAGPQPGQSQ